MELHGGKTDEVEAKSLQDPGRLRLGGGGGVLPSIPTPPPPPPGQKGERVRGARPQRVVGCLTLQLTRRASLSVLLGLLLLSWLWVRACARGDSPAGRLWLPSTRRLWITLCGCWLITEQGRG